MEVCDLFPTKQFEASEKRRKQMQKSVMVSFAGGENM